MSILGGKPERSGIRISAGLGKPTPVDKTLPMFENPRPPAVMAAPDIYGKPPFDIRLMDPARKKDRVRWSADG
jgi:hypothetical protein